MAEKKTVNWYEFRKRLDGAVKRNDVTHVQAILEEVDSGEQYEQYKYSLCMKVLKSQQLELVKLLFPTELVFKEGKLNPHINRDLMNSAIQADFVDGIKYLHSQGLVLQLSDLRWSALEESVKSNQLEVLQYLLTIYDLDLNPNPQRTLLMVASGSLNVKAIKLLLNTELRQTINQQSEREKYTALHWCLRGCYFIKVMECVKLLVETGADIHIMANGESPVIMAARQMFVSVVTYLVKRGADIYLKNKNQDSLLTYLAARGYMVYYEVSEYMEFVEALVKAGLDVNHRNRRNQTPVYLAVSNNNMKLLEALLHFKFDMESSPDTGTPLLSTLLALRDELEKCDEMLILAGCDVNVADEKGVTALMISIMQHNPGLVKLLIQYGANINVQDVQSRYPCDYVFQYFDHNSETRQQTICEILRILIDAGTDIYKCEHLLVNAIEKQCASVVKMLIDLHFPIDSTGKVGESALALAVEVGEESLVDLLISKGCNVNKMNKAGETVLYKAVDSSSSSTCNDMVSTLIKHGADTMVTNSIGKTLLMLAVRNKRLIKIERLIPPGPYVNQQDSDGTSALMFAVKYYSEIITKGLLCHKADPNLKDKHGETALLIAVKRRSEPLTKILLTNGADPSLGNVKSVTPIMVASQTEHHDGLLAMLLDADTSGVNLQDNDGNTALMLAVKKNRANNTKMLLQYGSNPNICANSGQTALMMATKSNHGGLLQIFLEASDEITEILLDHKADPNLKDKYGATALLMAVGKGNTKLSKILLNNGADLSLRNVRGKTPLMVASQIDHHDDLLEMLLDADTSSVNVQDNDGNTALMLAVKKNRANKTKMLLQNGSNPNICANYGQTALMCAIENNHVGLVEILFEARDEITEMLLPNKADPNLKDNFGETALLMAVRNGSELLTKILLNNGADPSLGTTKGLTPFMVASKKDGLLQLLLGADTSGVNFQDNKGNTALMLAVHKNRANNTKMLLQNMSNPNICANSGQNALMLAIENSNRGLVEILLEARADVNIVDQNGCSVLNYVNVSNYRSKWLNILKILLNNGCDVSLYNPRQNDETLLQSLLETKQADVSWYLITENCSLQNLNPKKVLFNLNYSDHFQLSKILYLCGISRADTESVCLLSAMGNGVGISADQTTITDGDDKTKSTLKEFHEFCNTIDLKSRCRLVIRDSIGPGIRKKITQVGLPTVLQDFVLLKDRIPEKYFNLTVNEDD